MPKSITVVMPDDTIWVADSFTQVTPPTPDQVDTVVPQTTEASADQTVAETTAQ